MDEKFKELLRRYTNNSATDLETAELMKLIRERKNREELENSFSDNPEVSDEEMLSSEREEVRRNILSAIKPESRRASFKILWIAASITVIASLVGVWLYNQSPLQKNMIAEQEKVFRFSGKDFVHLPDGSTVTLNEGSELSYSFTETQREVTLSGEAYFDVAHDAGKPFTVHTGKVKTRVLGTAFNVKAYPDQEEVLVTVTRGKVQVGNDQRTYGVIIPNEQIAVNTTTDNFIKTNLNAENTLAWKARFFIFENIDMDSAAKLISIRYGVKFKFTNPALKKCRFSSKFLNDESLSIVLDVVSATLNATYTVEDNGDVVISGKGCD